MAVEAESAPGLLLNPTRAQADAALREALSRAHTDQAVLIVHFLGHGSRYQIDQARPARHLLHLYDTVAQPTSTEPEHRGWDPYALIGERRPHISNMVGLVLLVDACYASWATQQVDAWSGVRGGLASAWLGASGDHEAINACLTKTVIRVLARGLDVDEHSRGLLVPELLVGDIAPAVAAACPGQEPRRGGFGYDDRVLHVGRNQRATQLGASLGLDAATQGVLLRLTGRHVTFATSGVAEAVRSLRAVALTGGPGTGKSTAVAALRHPPSGADDVPLAGLHAAAFAATATSLPEITRTLRGQLDRLPMFGAAAKRFERANAMRWETLDIWQQQITGPLTHYPDPVRVAVDGLDQLQDRPDYPAVRHALQELITDDGLSHVHVLVTGRTCPDLEGLEPISMPALDDDSAGRYLASLGLQVDVIERLTRIAAGNWLVLSLAADTQLRTGETPDTLPGIYDDLLARARARHGDLVDLVVAVLASAGPGPVLPFDLLAGALDRLGAPVTRAQLRPVLADADLHAIIDRTRPGTADEHLGLFHQTLIDYLAARPLDDAAPIAEVHRAVVGAIGELSPASRHDSSRFRADPVFTYAFDNGPTHLSGAGDIVALARDLANRVDTVPRVNLSRLIAWSDVISDQLGADHPFTLPTRINIAHWTGECGEPAEALRLSRDLLPDCQRVLGADHSDTLTARANIAFWTGACGEPAEALRLFGDQLPDQQRVLGADHPDTLKTRNNIAGWTGECGEPAEALRLSRDLLPDQQRVLGADHPDTLTTRNNIAHWTGECGEPAEALRLCRDLLTDRQRVLGDDHPGTLTTRNNITSWTGECGEPAEALRLCGHLLTDQKRVLGADHPDTLTIRNNIAHWTGRCGEPAEALRLLRGLLPDCQRVLGADHPGTLAVKRAIDRLTGGS